MNLVKTLFSRSKCVLNVGGGPTKAILGPRYEGMRQDILDIDPRFKPAHCCDAREMDKHIPAESYDAVFCAHNLEHYYAHEVPLVLDGFFHVLKNGGFVEIRVPDILAAIKKMHEHNADLNDILYQSPGGPIATIDVIYGWRVEIERSNQPYYAHKTAFSPLSLHNQLRFAGFNEVEIYKCEEIFEIQAFARKVSHS